MKNNLIYAQFFEQQQDGIIQKCAKAGVENQLKLSRIIIFLLILQLLAC
jgi:hypothetical protein